MTNEKQYEVDALIVPIKLDMLLGRAEVKTIKKTVSGKNKKEALERSSIK